jgi:hypothetical protein
VGVKIGVSSRELCDFFVAIPPAHIEKYWGNYPWRLGAGWVTDEVVDLHLRIIDSVRRLHGAIPLKSALIQDEAWTHSLQEERSGILIARDVAIKARLHGEPLNDLVCLPMVS